MIEPIEALIADGTLRLVASRDGFHEYDIPRLRHREMTWLGWQTITYQLTVEDDADPGCRYVIESDSRSSGGDVLVCTDDADEVECWIRERVGDGVESEV